MKKISLIIIINLLLINFAFSSNVPLKEAKSLAKHAFHLYSSDKNSDIKVENHFTKTVGTENIYHVFNMTGGGFIILSGDDNYKPVIGFSDKDSFDFDNSDFNTITGGMLEGHQANIEFIRSHKKSTNSKFKTEWTNLRASSANNKSSRFFAFTEIVSPLTTTEWGQAGFYNAECPEDEAGVNGNTYCGCVPVAVSQLMKYHNYPAQGNGALSYNSPNYGTQSADFCNTTYNWNNMPDDLTVANADVPQLIYQVGVAMETAYSTEYTGTYAYKLKDALVHFFGYDNGIKSVYGTNHNNYINIVTTELDLARPVLLAAFSLDANDNADIGHAWVADGYGNDMNGTEYIHFNWGWDGSNNGWFLDYMDVSVLEGYWDPLDDANSPISYFWYRDTYYEIFPAQDVCQAPSVDVVNAVPAENYAWMYFNTPSQIDVEIRHQYRLKNSQGWIQTNPTFEYAQLIMNLEEGQTYEFRSAKNCCSGWSDYSSIREFTTLGGLSCAKEDASSLSAGGVSDNFAWLYTSRPHGVVNNIIRYKKKNSTDAWIESNTDFKHYKSANNLSAGTTYEFQVNHECSTGNWSGFSDSNSFTTTGTSGGGELGCAKENVSGLSTSSISDNFAWLYTSRPHGMVNNQFRYRAQNSGDAWTESSTSSNYYRAASNLSSGTTYEFQVNHECSSNNWSGFSDSKTFTTTGATVIDNGGSPSDCAIEDASSLYTTSVSSNFAWMYTSTPHGLVNNQFRYRIQNSGNTWTESDISVLYYRSATNLSASTTYEFQVNHECTTGNWSGYSSSQTFTTTNNFNGEGEGNRARVRGQFNELEVYPNPTQSHLTINLPNSPTNIVIIDTSGKSYNSYTLNGRSQIDVSHLGKGVYYLQIENQEVREFKRFVKM